jgi:hypothetical protein
MKYLKERSSTLNTPPSASPRPLVQNIILMLGIMLLASWIHLPFAPIPWNFSFLATVLLSMVSPFPVAVCVTSLWILIGYHAAPWILPYMHHLNAPWAGYIWGMLCVTYFVCTLTQKKIRPIYIWLGALCILEGVSLFQYWRISPNLSYAKHTGLCALLPWHIFQVILGLCIGLRIQRGLRWILRRLESQQDQRDKK